MISSFHRKQKGAATLLIAIILIVTSTLIIIFAGQQGAMLSKITANQTRNQQAYQAAEAGLEFGINYLQQNSATILANPVGGFIPAYNSASTQNVALTDGSKFTIAYSNPVANNYNLILIKSTGTNPDGTTRVVQQQVGAGSILQNNINNSITSKGDITISGNTAITNTSTNQNIDSGDDISISGNGGTYTQNGLQSYPGHLGSDATQNDPTLSSMTQNNFFAQFFGTTSTATAQAKFANVYNNSSGTNYSSILNGKTGTTIWINQTGGTASLSGNTTIGTAANPVLIVVNGPLSISGNTIVYGFIFVIGATGITSVSGNTNITGGIATSDNLSMSGNTYITYDSSVLTNLRNQSSMSFWAKVPGTWKDF